MDLRRDRAGLSEADEQDCYPMEAGIAQVSSDRRPELRRTSRLTVGTGLFRQRPCGPQLLGLAQFFRLLVPPLRALVGDPPAGRGS